MRPVTGNETVETRPRKSSCTDTSSSSTRHQHHGVGQPTTFFLSRDTDIPSKPATTLPSLQPVTTSQDTLDGATRHSNRSTKVQESSCNDGSNNRRRSTIKAGDINKQQHQLRRNSSTTSNNDASSAMQPLPTNRNPMAAAGLLPLISSTELSTPNSPKSFSSRSPVLRLSSDDDGSATDDSSGGSQAIVSSDDDENNNDEEKDEAIVLPGSKTETNQPELIMPSIKMPSRRPFTSRGKQLGRYKIMVTGRKGVGKTSLIKSIVQICEDIVHVDPILQQSQPQSQFQSIHTSSPSFSMQEIFASTKPYPKWWMDLDESRVLRRRKSMGDSVLERNICFVDTSDSIRPDKIIHYLEQQLVKALASTNGVGSEFPNLLSGRGGLQVDVILYIISPDTIREDCECIEKLSELSNVIPLLAKSDLLSDEQRQSIKSSTSLSKIMFPTLSWSPEDNRTVATAPYTITSINGPDSDNMDASVLMSSEYIQPLLPSELPLVIDHLFGVETVAFLRHTAAQKLVSWHATHPKFLRSFSPSSSSVMSTTDNKSISASPQTTSLIHSGILIPPESELSLTTSNTNYNNQNSMALTKLADTSQREERLAQVRLSKWASDLQISLQREREKFERLARGHRASWLMERMNEEIRDGQIMAVEKFPSQTTITNANMNSRQDDEEQQYTLPASLGKTEQDRAAAVYQVHDPLGLLQWQETMRVRGWIALQLVGSFGVVGGLAVWFARTWGINTTILSNWVQDWNSRMFGNE